jgi:hypothetical protein
MIFPVVEVDMGFDRMDFSKDELGIEKFELGDEGVDLVENIEVGVDFETASWLSSFIRV